MIRYQVEVHDTHAHLLRVTMTIARPQAQQRLSLPVWIPGSYLVREFSRHLQGLEARQGGRALAVQQLDKCSWQVNCAARGALTLSYLVYAFDNSVRTAWLDSQRGFFNGTSVFLCAQGFERTPHEVRLSGLPTGWDVATALPARGKGRWTSADYDELIDHPFELGPFWRGCFTAGGVEHEFVVAGALPSFDGDRLLADTQRICDAQIRFWHGDEAPPFERYVFMLNAVDDSYGGLEHRASTALIAARRDLPRRGMAGDAAKLPDGYVTLLGLISHEYFHTWNVKRLKPAEFSPYDLSRENHSELLWFFEGFTSYYDDLFLVRTGLIDEARYLKLVAKTVNQVLGSPGRQVQSVAQASFDAWLKYYRPDENTANATISYYTKGALVAMALDLTLRHEGKGSLDAVMRRLWAIGAVNASGSETVASAAARPALDRPITEADIAAALRQVGRRDYSAELQAWVHGRDELPLQPLLLSQGVQWTAESVTVAQRLGARIQESGGALKVHSVLRGSAAETSGLAAGDELLAVDDWRLSRLDDLVLHGLMERPATLLISRDKRLLRLPIDGATQAKGTVALAADARGPAPGRRRRAAWLSSPPAGR